jgi:transcriptional regulator with XRE-family HTH domain
MLLHMSNSVDVQASGPRVWQYIKDSIGAESMNKFAARVGMGASQFTHWRNGDTQPSPELLARIADTLGVPHSALMTLAGYVEDATDMPQPVEPVRIEDAIELDNSWSAEEKEVWRQFHEVMQFKHRK